MNLLVSVGWPTDPQDLTLFVAGIGFVGGLAGAMIGFVGNWVTTSRQIARQERDRRREVYWRYLHAASVYRGGIWERHEIERRCEELLRKSPAEPLTLLGNEEALRHTSVLTKRADGLTAEVEHLTARLTGQIEQMHSASNEVALYGGPVFQDAASRVHDRGLELLRANEEEALDQAEGRYRAASTDFLSLARADTMAPGSAPLSRVVGRIQRLWAEDDWALDVPQREKVAQP